MSEPAEQESERLRAFRLATEKLLEAFNEGDYERAFSGASEDLEQIFPKGFVQDRLVGRRAVIRFFEEFRADVGNWRLTPNEFVELGPHTFVVGYEGQGIGKASGIVSGLDEWDVIEVDSEGRTRRITQFWDRDEALVAAADKESAA